MRSSSVSAARPSPKKMLEDYPAFVRLYDILIDDKDDLRPLSWEQRRIALEAFVPRLDPERFDISQVIPAAQSGRTGLDPRTRPRRARSRA